MNTNGGKKRKLGAPPPMEREAEVPPRIPSGIRRDEGVGYFLLPGEELMQCPYSKDHRIRLEKFPYHLVKCEKNYWKSLEYNQAKDEDRIVPCIYNNQHRMPKGELEEHYKVCPSNLVNTASASNNESWEWGVINPSPGPRMGSLGDPGVGPYGDNETSGPGFWPVKDNVKK